MLLDTNIVIHACQPGGEWLAPWTTHPDAAIASVTRIEALGFAGISPEEETAIIAATAVTYGIPLITRNEGDFKHIPGLDLRNPFAISP